jgi:hypothetical protein
MMRSARRLAVGFVLASLLQISPPASPIDPSVATAATARIGSFGTATVDGVETAGEWAAADVLDLFVPRSPLRGSGHDPRPATLSLMNDGTNLYAAIRVPGVHERTDVELQFDEDHDRRLERNDDVLAVSVLPTESAPRALPLRDRFLHCVTVSSPNCRTDDTSSATGDPPAGTTDGRAAGGVDGTGDFIELVHPLASGDAAHDIQTAPGRILGLRVVVKIATGVAQGCPDPTCLWEGGFNTGDLVLATAAAPFATPSAMAGALRVEGATVSPGSALPGTTVDIAFRVVNRSGAALVVPTYGRSGRHLGARIVETIENEDDPGRIGARSPTIDPLPVPSDTVSVRGADVVAAIIFRTSLPTSSFAPGHYRHQIAIVSTTDTTVVSAVSVRFELKSVIAEWSAKVGTAGRNGTSTLRALSTGDGTLGLALRNLPRRRSYAASIVRRSCTNPTTVTRAGTVTTDSSGAVARTLALSRSAMTATIAASASGPIFIRLTSGTSIRCARLTVVPVYTGRLSWEAVGLAPARGSDGMPTPTSANSVTVFGSRLLVGGSRWGASNEGLANVVWSSTDGSSWTTTPLGTGRSRLALATDGEIAVAVGAGVAWRTTDGITWTPASAPPGVEVQSILPALTALPGGGFLAGVWPEPYTAGCELWSTTDGDRWVKVTPSGLPSGTCISLEAGPSIIIAAGLDWIASSLDGGATWTTGLRVGGGAHIRGTSATAVGFIAHGSAMWSSPDGRTWRQTSTIPTRRGYEGTTVTAVVPFGPGLVGVGGSHIPADLVNAEVLVSGDGTSWRLSPRVMGWISSHLNAAAVWGDRLVVVGDESAFYWGEESRAVVWIARLLPDG